MPMRGRLQRTGCVVLFLAGVLCPAAGPACAKPTATPRHVVLVIFGGGVRVEHLTDKARMPHVAALAAEGRVFPRVVSDATDGPTAVARILTGASSPGPDLATAPPQAPTLAEYVRDGRKLPAEQVWHVAFDGSAAERESHSTHPNLGKAFAPRVAFGAGPVGEPLTTFLEQLGRPVPLAPAAFELLTSLRRMNATVAASRLPLDVRVGLPAFDRVERAVLKELDRRAALVRGPNPADERAWRAAQTVLRIHRPLLTIVRLGEAEIADTSPARYRAVMKANDRSFARLRALVEADKAMQGGTLFVLLPDRQRVERDGALPVGPGMVSVVVHGPGMKRWSLKGPRRVEDVCPTIAAVLGVETPEADGRSWLRP